MLRYRTFVLSIFCACLTACSVVPSYFNAYKIDIQQGNVLTQEMVAQLKPGQTRDQVRYILGTPLITDVFHQQRWDYLYRYLNGRTGAIEQRKFSVFFGKDNLLERVGGDVASAVGVDPGEPATRSRVVDLGSVGEGSQMPPPEAPGFFRRLLNWVGL